MGNLALSLKPGPARESGAFCLCAVHVRQLAGASPVPTYDSGRLQEAVGEPGANDLLEHTNDNLVRNKQILRNQNAAKAVGRP